MMLIKNYGLFWRKRNVFWGYKNNAGRLMGFLSTATADDAVDFREQQGVYVLYDETFRMIHVGQTGSGNTHRLLESLRQHTKDNLADRWDRFSWFGIRKVNKSRFLQKESAAAHIPTSGILNHIEAILVLAAEPTHNKQSGRFGSDVKQYLQCRDADELDPDINEMIRDIWNATTQS